MPRILILSNPRSGSNYLLDLLACHPEIELDEELLNDEFGLIEAPLETIQKSLSTLHSTFVGFKTFPEQVYSHGLHFGELLQTIGATHVIVLWRDDILEALASRRIADANGEWYSTSETNKKRTVKIDLDDLETYSDKLFSEWEKIGSQWPVDVRPIFVRFEDLIQQPIEEVTRVLAELSCASDHIAFCTPSVRQNPAPVHEKVTNFDELPVEQRDKKLNVKSILLEKINISLQIPSDLLQFAPDREPCMPPSGWKYRVAEPYLPSIAKQNAFDAIQSGSISSAGYWPREMAKRLRSVFHCPVAQPCSNGFTALMLAMQAANIGEGDEVIVPTMTMVAVPNAVYYVRGIPIFADNANGGYNPTWSEYESVSTPKTKAIIVTHTYGVPVPDIQEIADQCAARGWILIEDISECVGVTCSTAEKEERLLGTFGDFAIASMYANKIVHGGDGGFVLAKEAKHGKRLASIVNHGFTPSFHFVHFEQAPNAKIHGIGAAIAAGCLDEVKNIMEHRSFLSKLYRKNLENLPIKLMPPCGPQDTPWVFGLQCATKQERTQIRAFMAQHGIETRDYFFNLHLQPAYLQRNSDGTLNPAGSLPNAEILGSTGFYLPTHTNLTENDVVFICTILKSYFQEKSSDVNIEALLPNPKKFLKSSVQISPDGFALHVRKYRETGELQGIIKHDHVYLQAVKLGYEAEEILLHERYDQVENIVEALKSCIMRVDDDPLSKSMRTHFSTYIDYFESQVPIEQPVQRPWLTVDLNNKMFDHSKSVPTTTDPETLQFLTWLLQKQKPSTIWEIGSWLGHATTLMAEVCTSLDINYRIFACDAFKWQAWMNFFVEQDVISEGKSFLKIFQQNVQPFTDNIEAVNWSYDISKLPTVLENQRPQLVFLDITQENDDLEDIWSMIKPNLIPNETIILFNGMTYTSIPFFTRHAHELTAVAKPNTLAKAFQFVDTSIISTKSAETYDEVMDLMRKNFPLQRKLKFHTNPGWDHHHRNLFCKSIELLREEMHSDEADILFIPAIEETMCDEPDMFYQNNWIGIIHSVAHHPEFFYTPDLSRLCTRMDYLEAMKNCKGLYTLTSFQAEYLKTHLPPNLQKFPIQRLLYPVEVDSEVGSSLVPDLMRKEDAVINVTHIGSFARDFDFFFRAKLPPKFQKVFVAADEETQEISKQAPKDVKVVGRLSAGDYEKALKTSVVFLTLKYEGAANTLILECIARNIPILSPATSSCEEYLGKDYPLFYDPSATPEEIESVLTLPKIESAIDYLKNKKKDQFSHESFINDVRKGTVMLSIPPSESHTAANSNNPLTISVSEKRNFENFDVTLCICSYKRTHHLPKLLDSLWNNQDFQGTFQILIWNNNDARSQIVRDHAMKYIQQSTSNKSLELVSSTNNYYCSIRFAMPALMRSDCLLICDDDIIPGTNFISFFFSAHQRHPDDVLCVRGHEFLPHQLEPQNPSNVWMDYDSLRFYDDHQPEQLIHFVHADACLIPKQALQEVASTSLSDHSFALVDDYWMSFILNHKFNRKLRKLSVKGLSVNPIVRTEDSDQPGLALHTRAEVQDARLRLYVHHMLQGWPNWQGKGVKELQISSEVLREKKVAFWDAPPQIGFNISSTLDMEGIAALKRTGAKCVRIGAVGVGGVMFFELSRFLTSPQEELARLEKVVGNLEEAGIDMIVTLERRIASPETWKLIAGKLKFFGNVVGYDLINEPFTGHENDLHWKDIETDMDDCGRCFPF